MFFDPNPHNEAPNDLFETEPGSVAGLQMSAWNSRQSHVRRSNWTLNTAERLDDKAAGTQSA